MIRKGPWKERPKRNSGGGSQAQTSRAHESCVRKTMMPLAQSSYWHAANVNTKLFSYFPADIDDWFAASSPHVTVATGKHGRRQSRVTCPAGVPAIFQLRYHLVQEAPGYQQVIQRASTNGPAFSPTGRRGGCGRPNQEQGMGQGGGSTI